MGVKIKETKPSEEMVLKIRQAREAIVNQKHRTIKCPYCQHNTIVVFADARGHVQTKCKRCGRETVFDVLSMRRIDRQGEAANYRTEFTR